MGRCYMKNKKAWIIVLIEILLVLVVIFLIILFSNLSLKNKFNKFDYVSAKTNSIKYLNKNEEQLKELVDELYESKSSKEDPYKEISYASYCHRNDLDFEDKKEYIIISLDTQGILGGQYYGLIYSEETVEDLIVYDEYKETGNGNNKFIRQKIRGNWYFYYDDFDGKVDITRIIKTYSK